MKIVTCLRCIVCCSVSVLVLNVGSAEAEHEISLGDLRFEQRSRMLDGGILYLDLLNRDGKVVALVVREGDELMFKTYLTVVEGKGISPSWAYKKGVFSLRIMVDYQIAGEVVLDSDSMVFKMASNMIRDGRAEDVIPLKDEPKKDEHTAE